ncbi:hypothetical protein HZS_1035 [Henneguya salminicola]|nr:hypothetical protein HZS_1035 [Henneguya salminicola]
MPQQALRAQPCCLRDHLEESSAATRIHWSPRILFVMRNYSKITRGFSHHPSYLIIHAKRRHLVYAHALPSSIAVLKTICNPPRAPEKEKTDDSSSISSSSSSEPSPVPVQPPAQIESTSAAFALLSIREKKTVPEISPVIPRRALNIRVSTRIPLQTAQQGKREGKNSGLETDHKGPARPKGSQRHNTSSKAKAAAERHRTARPRPAKARGPSQQPFSNPFIQAPAPCAHSAYPGYTPFPGYCCYPVVPFQAPLVCHNQSAAQNPMDLLIRYIVPPPKDAIEVAEDKDSRLGSKPNAFIITFSCRLVFFMYLTDYSARNIPELPSSNSCWRL